MTLELLGVLPGAASSFMIGWLVTEKLLRRRLPAAHVRGQYCHCKDCERQRGEEIERGKPENYVNGRYLHASQQRHVMADADLLLRAPHTKDNRCTNCGAKCRKTIYHPSWSHPGLKGTIRVALCEPCFQVREAQGEGLVSHWMGFERAY